VSQYVKKTPLSGGSNKQAAPLQLTGDDAVVPFAVEALSARGRTVRLGASVDALLARHNYPEPVAGLVAQAAALTALLGSSLKFQGKFSLQTQTDGPVNMLICDYVAPSAPHEPASIRAYARFDKAKFAALSPAAAADQAGLMGNGSLAFTIDQGAQMQLYQGIVALDHMNLEQAAQQYFAQSEQIPTKIRLASAVLMQPQAEGAPHSSRRAGGIMAQFLPYNSADEAAAAKNSAEIETARSDDDKWRETEALVATASDAELTDPQLPAEQLLYRLFHEQGARVYSPQHLVEKCTCSRDKLFCLLAGFSAQERQDSAKHGVIHAKCEFCSAEYDFRLDEFPATAQAERGKAAEQPKKAETETAK